MSLKYLAPELASSAGRTSRREFLGYGGLILGASVLAPVYPLRAVAASAVAFDFYISPTGSDSNSGSQSSPWALTALNTKRSTYAGHRVGVLPGTYDCAALVAGSYANDFANPAFNIAGGTASSPTVIQSTTPRAAILNAGANATNNSAGQPLIGTYGSVAGNGYITIDGFEITNCYNRAISIGRVTGAAVPSSRLSGMVVQGCFVHGITNQISGANTTGITMYSCDGAVIQNNYVTDIQDSTSRGTGIEIWTSTNCIIQFNSIVSTSPQHTGGIFQKNVGNRGNTYQYNFIDMTLTGRGGSGGLALDDDGDGTVTDTISNNIIIGDLPVYDALIVTGKYPSSLNNQIWRNNTLVGIPGNSVTAWVRFGAPGTISFFNNIIATSGAGGRGQIDTSASALALVDFNCYSSPLKLGLSANGSTNYPDTLYSSMASWAAALPSGTVGKDAHSLVADPVFVGTGTGADFYKLQSSSPCVGRGTADGKAGSSVTDMGAWGNGATQIGCDFGAAALPDAPVLEVS